MPVEDGAYVGEADPAADEEWTADPPYAVTLQPDELPARRSTPGSRPGDAGPGGP